MMHRKYVIYIYIYSNNFREAIIEMGCNMEDLVMVNVAADIDEVRDVILALLPRLHTALVKRECEGCTIYRPSQTHHPCLDPVDEETTKTRIDQCLATCSGELIRMVYVSNNKPMTNIEVSSVLEIHRQLIIDSFQIVKIGSVNAEEMILHFLLNMDLLSYK